MSVSRLVVGLVCLALAAYFFRARRRLDAGSDSPLATRPRALGLITAIAWIATLVGVLWILVAFA